jgi:hypothetical protein
MYNFNTLNTPKISAILGTHSTPSSSNIDVNHKPLAYTSSINVNKPYLYYRERSKLNN